MRHWTPENALSIEMIPDSTAPLDDAAAARRKAFVDAAREAFFTNGYAGTTMSSIASKVGGSKTTLWSYFPSKEDLFEAVVDGIVEEYGDALAVDLPLDEPVPEVLRRFGNLLMTKLTATPILSLFRLVVGEAERFPHLAKTFYDRGPRRGKARAAEWVGEKMARGEIRRSHCRAGHAPPYELKSRFAARASRASGLRRLAALRAAFAAAFRAWACRRASSFSATTAGEWNSITR